MALTTAQTAITQAASPTPSPSNGDSNPAVVLPTNPEGPQPARVVEFAIPPDAASGGAPMDPSIEARPLVDPVEAPAQAMEVEDARTERTRLTANPNGTFTLEQSTGRIHYQTASGEWEPINLSLLPTAGSDFDLRVAANDRDLRLATESADGAVAQLGADGRTLQLVVPIPVDGDRSTDSRQGVDRLTYPLGEGQPVIYVQPTTDGLTYGATLADAQTEPVVDLVLRLDGYRARLAADGVTIELIAPIGEGEPVLEPTPTPSTPSATPTATPSATPDPSPTPTPSGEPTASPGGAPSPTPEPTPSAEPSPSVASPTSPSPAVSPSLEPTGSPSPSASQSPSPTPISPPTTSPSAPAIGTISPPVILEGPDRLLTSAPLTFEVLPGEAPDEIRVRYLLDPAWLAAPERQFPIELDPSICVQAGGSGCTSANDVVNTYIGSGQPNTYPNPASVLRVGDDALPDVAWNTLRTLIWFQTQTLPDGAVVTGATLRLREDNNYDASTAPQIIARPISYVGWGTTATWSQLGNAVRSGMDSPAVSPCSTGSTDCDLSLNVEAAVRSWYTRRAKDWRTNNGVQVRLATESTSLDEIDFYVSSGCTNSTCPKLTITYEVPQVGIDFDPLLGRVYAPSTMIAGRTTRLPVVVTNNGSAQDFSTSAYEVGYRWFDAKGNQGSLPKGTTALPGCIGVGGGCQASRGPFALSVAAPSAPGMYTLRLDLVRVDGPLDLWASDWATPSKYFSRNKKFLTADDTRWVGSSVIERDEFPITVVKGGGTNAGERRTVITGAGDELGIGLASRDLSFRGDTGLGFADRIGLGLRYGYSQLDAAGCTGYQGILGACGWWTTFDERISGGPNATGYDYTYQDPHGDRHLLDTDSEGQISAGAPVLLNRPRHTLLDDNEAPSASVTAVNAATAGFAVFSGQYANRASSNTSSGPGLPDKVNLNVHKYLRFALRTTSVAQSGLCLKVHNLTDSTTYPDRWFCYTLGTPNWTTGFDQVYLNTEAGVGSLTAGWNDYSRDMWNDIRLDGDFGRGTDEYQVISAQIQSTGSGSGFTYLDALRFESRESQLVPDESNPAWTTGAALASSITPSGDDGPAVSGSKVLRVLPANPNTSASPLCRTTNSCWSSSTGGLDSYAFAHWYWKKVGGTTAAMVVYVRDQRSGAPCSASDCSLTYYAGEAPPPFNSSAAIQVSAVIPEQWTLVRRNILADARTALGLFDDAGSGGPDQVKLVGYGPIAVDGSHLLVDHAVYGNLADIGEIDPTGAASPVDRPTTVGDTTRTWDFSADYADGSRHYFNRDGLLTHIRDLDGFEVTLDWTVTAPTTGPASYRLDKIRAPHDGASSGGVTFERELELSRGTDGSLATLRFDEDLGSTGDDRSAHAVVFEMTSGATPDLMKVSPARHIVGSGASGTFCGSAPSGCIEFSYTDGTNHRLEYVADPRWDGTTSGSQDWRFAVTRSGSDPMAIVDRSHGIGGTALLNILTYGDTRDASLDYDRVQYQDAAAGAADAAIAVDLAPGGALFTGYAPRECDSTPCSTSSSSWPDEADQAAFKTVRHEFDGVAKTNTVRTYRCPASSGATAGCTGTTEQISLSRQARRAGARVDNYADPLAGEEIAWRQSAEQWFASVKDSGGGNPDLYRTDYRYDGRHRLVATREPAQLATSTYPDALGAQSGLTNWWRLDETTGNATDSKGSATGTVSGATQNQAGLLVRAAADRAYLFDGSNDRVYASTSLSQSAYSIEAWVRPGSNVVSRTLAGRWANGSGGAMLWADGAGKYALVHTDDGANYLRSGVRAMTERTDHVVGTWSGKDLRLYVNGELVGARAMTTAPGTGASSFEIGAAYNATAYFFHGRIDEVGLYNRALTPDEVASHYAAGVATAVRDTRIARDRLGRPTITADQFLVNGGFESGLTAWDKTGSPSATSAAQRTGAPGGLGAALTSGQAVTQIVSVVPGQTVRLQYHQSGTGAGLDVAVASWPVGGSAWDSPILSDSNSSTSWTGHAWDLVVPIDSDGRLKLTFTGTDSGIAYLDDAVVLTRWTSTAYGASGPSAGLPTSIDTLLPGCDGCGPTIRATLGYAAGTSTPNLHPAIFPTTSIANDVASVADPTTDDVTTTTTYDAWGRSLTVTDPDGVTASTSYDANATDVASTGDDPDNGTASTSFTYDAVGNRLTVTSPLGRVTSTTYNGVNQALTVTAPDGTVSRTDVNGHGQPIRGWANYVNGTVETTDGDATDDLLTVRTFDAYGRIVLTQSDCGATGGTPDCGTGLDARASTTYDLPGTTVTSTVAAASAGGSTRTTTARFETLDPSVGPYALEGKLSRLQPTGTLLAIGPDAAAPTCPDGSGDCNSVTTLDLAGRAVSSTDGYGIVTRVDLDLDGRTVRTILNDTAGALHGSANDENLVTLTRYDLLGRSERTTTVIDEDDGDRWTRTIYDPLGRAIDTITGSGSITLINGTSTQTRFTAAGRVQLTSSTEVAGADDHERAWTRTEYDADGRAVRTVANSEQGDVARRVVDHFEGQSASHWSSTASGFFTTSAAASGPAFDPQASTIPAATGAHRLRVTTSASGANSGLWRDYSGPTFQGSGATYRLRASLWAPSGQAVKVYLGVDASGTNHATTTVTGTGAWQTVTLDWDPDSDVSTNVHAAFRKDASGSVDFALDDVMLYETGTANEFEIATDTAYDLDGRVIASVAPPGDADGDRPLVTRTAYDALDRVVAISTNALEPYAAAIRGTTGLAGYWPLDEPAGSTVDDRQSATDLTLAGNRMAGVGGGLDEARTAFRFDGATGTATRTSSPVSATDDFALEAWFRYDAVPSSSQLIAYNGTSTTGWGIGFTGGKLAGLYGSTWLDSGQVPTAGDWHHVLLTRSSGTATIYLDGTAHTPTNSTATPATPGAAFAIGRQDATAGRYFAGDVDEVAVYGAALGGTTVAAHWAAGRQTSVVDGLTTRTVYDRLGRVVDATDQANVRTRYGYDRLGSLTSVVRNHRDGTPSGELGVDDVISTYGRNLLGELIGYCTGKNIWDASQAGPAVCDPVDAANDWAWHYAYDALGRLIRQTPPENQSVTDLAGLEWEYEGSGRLIELCEDLDGATSTCSGTPKRTTYDHDDLGRVIEEEAIESGSSTVTTTTAYGLDGQPTSVTEGTTTVAIAYVAETGLPDTVSMGGSVVTDYTWANDGTLTSRQDGGASGPTVGFEYDWAKRLTTIDPPDADYGSGELTRTYRLDGLLASQGWPNGESATLVYDTARRPTAMTLTASRSLSRSYDRTGRVTADDRYLGSGIAAPAGDGTLTYAYDPLGRITETKLDGAASATYTYDRGSNRRTKTEGGATFTYAHDRTDAIVSQKIGAGTPENFEYDSAGNVTHEWTKAGVDREYVWDAADRLTRIDDPTGNDADLEYDPLDRVRTRTVGSDEQTFDHVGVSDVLWRQAGATTSSGLIDADGSRVASRTGSNSSWLLFDLLGSVVAAEGTSGTSITDAFRYDAWGQTLGLYPSGGSPLSTRFRGLVDLAPTADPDVSGAGSDPLYLMGARTYSPHTGSFTSLDSYAGQAIDPASLHRYLYAHANPTTLIDPTGHVTCEKDSCGPGYDRSAPNTPKPPTTPNASGSPDDRDRPATPNNSGSPDDRSGTTSTGTQRTAGGSSPLVVSGNATVADILSQVAQIAGVPRLCGADDTPEQCLEKSQLRSPCELLEIPGSNQSLCQPVFQLSDEAASELLGNTVGRTRSSACQSGGGPFGALVCATNTAASGLGSNAANAVTGSGKGVGGATNPLAGQAAVARKIGDLLRQGTRLQHLAQEVTFYPNALGGKRLKVDLVVTVRRSSGFVTYEIKSGSRVIFTANQRLAGFEVGKSISLQGEFRGANAVKAGLPTKTQVNITVFVEHR